MNELSKLYLVAMEDIGLFEEMPDVFDDEVRAVIEEVRRSDRRLTLEEASAIAGALGTSPEALLAIANTSHKSVIPYKYKTNEFSFHSGFTIVTNDVMKAACAVNDMMILLPDALYKSIDLKTTSAMIGALFCSKLADYIEGAIVNPIEKGNPDIVPCSAKNCTEEELRTYPYGVEVKVTVGGVKKGSNLSHGDSRLDYLSSIVWQAHHREGKELLGLVWDYRNEARGFSFPMITAAYFADSLEESDWGKISGTTGRNTKVTAMLASGLKKMGRGQIIVCEECEEKYQQLLKVL